jgi:glycine/D-amino acid oxidase-like deaminating enzyme
MQVLIVGGGLAGACLAAALGQVGCTVTVIERSQVASAASAVPLAVLQPVTGKRLSVESAHVAGMELTGRWLDRAGESIARRWPLLRVALDEATAAEWHRRIPLLAQNASNLVQWCDADTCRVLEPLASPGVRGGVRIADARIVRMPLLVEYLLKLGRAAVVSGVDVTAVGEAEDGVWADCSDGVRRHAQALWLCEGAAGRLIPEVARELQYVGGELVEVESPQAPEFMAGSACHSVRVPADWRTDVGAGRRPAMHRVVLAATYKPGMWPARLRAEGVTQLLSEASEALPGLLDGARVVSGWSGVRPVLRRMHPWVGAAPGFGSRVRVLTGLGSRGLLLGPMLAESEARWALEESKKREPSR